MAESQRSNFDAMLSISLQPQLPASAPTPTPTPTHTQLQTAASSSTSIMAPIDSTSNHPANTPLPAPVWAPQLPAAASASVTAPVASTTNRLPEHLMHKNRLQEHAQRSGMPLPVYGSTNEGHVHAPKFRASVLVDGVTYTSPNTFSHKKAAEQDVARLALECISKKIKDEGCPLINEDTIFCKSILNEFAVKMNLELPAYSTRQAESLLPVFVSSLVFKGITYIGEAGRTKKEAEQLAARAVIRTLLDTSGYGTLLSEIINSKYKLYAALRKVKDPSCSNQNSPTSNVPIATIPQPTAAIQPTVIPEASTRTNPVAAFSQASGGLQQVAEITEETTGMHPTATKPDTSTSVHSLAAVPEESSRMNMPHHPFMKPDLEPSSEPLTLPISCVPAVLGQPFGTRTSSAHKRRKNKNKANKKLRTHAQLHITSQPLTEVPPCSIAQ